jgi:uncharacterized membrane protein
MDFAKTISKVIKILVFMASLLVVCWFIGSLYLKNYKKIIDGTYVYDRFEAPLMMSPLLIVFLLFLYLWVKLYSKKVKQQ